MNFLDLIEKKKCGNKHTKDEIYYLVNSYMQGDVSDAQMSAWLTAVTFSGLDVEETSYLTSALGNSGKVIDFGDMASKVVDKHSTGGVGDKVTITLIPLLAAAGVPVAKLADRSVGNVAGTVDKLESIPHFNTRLDVNRIVEQLKNVNAVIASQDDDLAPADKRLYALRNKIGAINNDSLITSSIISKKIATGASNIIIDVKYGAGAYKKTPEEAMHLAKMIVDVGKSISKSIDVIVSSMDEPLGRAIGNSLEVIEAIEFLKGAIKDGDLVELTYTIATMALLELNFYETKEEALNFLKELVGSGAAINKFRELIAAQGGVVDVINDYDKFMLPAYKVECEAKKEGYIHSINAYQIALALKMLDGSREKNIKPLDLSVGIFLNKKCGEFVKKGETLYTIYSNDSDSTIIAQKYCDGAFLVKDCKVSHKKLIHEIISTIDEDYNV